MVDLGRLLMDSAFYHTLHGSPDNRTKEDVAFTTPSTC